MVHALLFIATSLVGADLSSTVDFSHKTIEKGTEEDNFNSLAAVLGHLSTDLYYVLVATVTRFEHRGASMGKYKHADVFEN